MPSVPVEGASPDHDLAELELAGIDLQAERASRLPEAGYLQFCFHREGPLHSTFRYDRFLQLGLSINKSHYNSTQGSLSHQYRSFVILSFLVKGGEKRVYPNPTRKLYHFFGIGRIIETCFRYSPYVMP